MEKFDIHILGCGSALPTTRHYASSQVVEFRNKMFMIDCGEGAQLQLRRSHLHFSRLNHIFISHLHGDHCFGLIGLISTFGLLGRTADLHIYSPAGLQELLEPQLDFFCKNMNYKVVFHTFETSESRVIYEDRTLMVTSIPLSHRMPCAGFLFAEKPKRRHILREWIDFYKVPVFEINRIKNGEDYITPGGECIPNEKLTSSANPVRKYAYCSDTMYYEPVIPIIQGVDLLFHEATFAESEQVRAKETFHCTAKQAATIALKAQVKRLVIGHYSARYENDALLVNEARSIFINTIQGKENICLHL